MCLAQGPQPQGSDAGEARKYVVHVGSGPISFKTSRNFYLLVLGQVLKSSYSIVIWTHMLCGKLCGS